MPITAAEIAKICNVSRTTVDRALKNKSGISPETRERICAIAKQYDYRPNYLASSLSTGRTFTIGVIVFDLYNQHFAELVNGIEQYFSNLGVHTYICISHKDKEREKSLIQTLADRKVDGILLVPINYSAEFCKSLHDLAVPLVCVSNQLPGFPCVSGDNQGGVYAGMEDFYRRNYRTVHFVCPPLRYKNTENIHAQESRAAGYLSFMEAHPDMKGELITGADYADRAIELILNAPEPPGIFCSSDLFMLDIRRRIIDMGLDIESCCALMGVDGLWMLEHLTRRPPTISYPAEMIGRTAAKMLDDLINGRPADPEILVPCTLLPGNIEN